MRDFRATNHLHALMIQRKGTVLSEEPSLCHAKIRLLLRLFVCPSQRRGRRAVVIEFSFKGNGAPGYIIALYIELQNTVTPVFPVAAIVKYIWLKDYSCKTMKIGLKCCHTGYPESSSGSRLRCMTIWSSRKIEVAIHTIYIYFISRRSRHRIESYPCGVWSAHNNPPVMST